VKNNPLRSYIRPGYLPHMFCPGCGAGQVLHFFVRAADDLGLDFDKLVAIGGVGCAARIPVYLHADVLHGVHGRTLPWAMGIKLYKPDLKVVIFAGDGDAAAIGGNHLIHAARRNLDVTMIVVNNLNFGMTGGQMAPTTPMQCATSTTPFGNQENPFDLCALAQSAGATFVSRWATTRPVQTIRAIKKALTHNGFAFLEIISQCPTNFGRRALSTGEAVKVRQWIADRTVTLAKAAAMDPEKRAGAFVLGDFHQAAAPVFRGTSVSGTEE